MRCCPTRKPLFDEHRAAGRPLVIATTTPIDLVRPLAEALGFDDVIATRYGVSDGHYDGTIDGQFVWGKDKARAVAEWAGAHDVDLDASLRLLRQLLRRPAAVDRGTPDGGQPRPPDARRRHAAALAGGAPRRARRRAQVRSGWSRSGR